MLRDAFFIARKDTQYMLTRRETITWTFVMPVVFFYFIGTITGNNIHTDAVRDPIAVQVPADAGFLADDLLARLKADNYRVVRPDSPRDFASFARRLEIPAGFTDDIRAGKTPSIRFARTGDDSDAQFDRVRITRALYAVMGDLAVAGANPTAERLAEIGAAPRTLVVDTLPAGKRLKIPNGYEQSVPGTMVMFTLLVLFTSGAVSLTIERHHGILRRLASSPMSRGAVVLGKWGSRMAIGVIQIAFAMLAGRVLFHVEWGGSNLPAVALVLVTYGALAAALAMLLGNAGQTEGQVIAIGVICSNVMAGLGGCWWPIEVTPRWAQKLAVFLPTGLTMDALHKLVNFGAGAGAVIPHVCVLAAAAALALYALSRTFRFQ